MTKESSSFNFSLPVLENANGTRLDIFLRDHLEQLSREKIKSAIKKGHIFLDGAVCISPKQILRAGQEISACLSMPSASLDPEQGDVQVLYKDNELVLINKPAGITVHPCPSCPNGTLANRLVAKFPELLKQEGFRPGIVHRLDKDTSGLMIVALTEKTRIALCEQFAEHQIYKEYLAIVHGVLKHKEGTVDVPIGRDPQSKIRMAVINGGKPAKTAWKTLYADTRNQFSLLAVRIFTGRTHQIRVHMAYLGHPLIGDSLYKTDNKAIAQSVFSPSSQNVHRDSSGNKKDSCLDRADASLIKRQMLHAWRLAISHPWPEEINEQYFEQNTKKMSDKGVAKNIDSSATHLSLSKKKKKELSLQIDEGFAPSLKNDILENGFNFANSPHFYAKRQNDFLIFSCPPPQDMFSTLEILVSKPLKVIITGMPGCGKSTVLQEFAQRGIPTFSADQEVESLYAKEGNGAYLIQSRYGEEYIAEDGSINKKLLSLAMRQNEKLRREIESLIHPLVFHSLASFFCRSAKEKNQLAIAEIPLFFEAGGLEKNLEDSIVLGVECPFALRSKRLFQRGWADDTVAAMESWQWPEKKKMSACHYTIENTGSKEELLNKVATLKNELLTLREKRIAESVAKIRHSFE